MRGTAQKKVASVRAQPNTPRPQTRVHVMLTSLPDEYDAIVLRILLAPSRSISESDSISELIKSGDGDDGFAENFDVDDGNSRQDKTSLSVITCRAWIRCESAMRRRMKNHFEQIVRDDELACVTKDTHAGAHTFTYATRLATA